MLKAFRAILVAMTLAATYTVKAVYESGKWVLRSVRDSFRPPVGAGAQVEAEMEDLSAEAHAIAAAAQAPVAANDDGLMKLIPVPEYDASKDWGAIAKAYVKARVYAKAEPDLSDLDEHTEVWLRSLSTDECFRLQGLAPERISAHIFGSHRLRGLAPCHKYNTAYPALLMAEVEKPDARHQEILDDLENDPESVPGYRVA